MSEPVAHVELAAPAPPEAAHGPAAKRRERNPVIDHLLFQRAMADHDPEQIDHLLALAQDDVAGFPDPFDKAIANAFRLVLDEHMDPWRIDLVRFSKLYAERVADEEEVDLITAGRLLAMAWTILLRQTEGLLERAQPPEPEEQSWDLAWDQFPDDWGIPVGDAGRLFTQRVLTAPEPPITESVFHQGNRRVTLYELVEALEEARHDAEVRMRLAAERAKARKEAKTTGKENMKKIHKEDLEAEILDVRRRLQGIPEEVTFAQVHDGTREDFLTVFIACLFLSRAEMVDVRQENFPFGPMLVKPLPAIHDPDAPLIGLPTKGPAAARGNNGADDARPEDDHDDDAADPVEDEPARPEVGPHAG